MMEFQEPVKEEPEGTCTLLGPLVFLFSEVEDPIGFIQYLKPASSRSSNS